MKEYLTPSWLMMPSTAGWIEIVEDAALGEKVILVLSASTCSPLTNARRASRVLFFWYLICLSSVKKIRVGYPLISSCSQIALFSVLKEIAGSQQSSKTSCLPVNSDDVHIGSLFSKLFVSGDETLAVSTPWGVEHAKSRLSENTSTNASDGSEVSDSE